jgi:hypothetical protein
MVALQVKLNDDIPLIGSSPPAYLVPQRSLFGARPSKLGR